MLVRGNACNEMGSGNLHAAAWRLLIKDSAVKVYSCAVPSSSDAGNSGLLALTVTELRDVGLALLLSGPNLLWIPSLKDKVDASCLPTDARHLCRRFTNNCDSSVGCFFLLTFLPPKDEEYLGVLCKDCSPLFLTCVEEIVHCLMSLCK